MNQGSIIGRLTRDMELTYSKNNNPIGKGSIAYQDKYSKDKVHFFNFTAFGKTAQTMCQYLKKGNQVGLTFSLSQNRWTDQNGQNRSTVDLIVNEFSFCGSKNESGKNQQQENINRAKEEFDANQINNDDEVPF